MGCRLWVSILVVYCTMSGAPRAAGSERCGPGSVPVVPALTGPALAAVGTPANLSWGCPLQTHPPAQEARIQAAVGLQNCFTLATGRLQEACELLVRLGSRAKLLSLNTKTECFPGYTGPWIWSSALKEKSQFANLRVITSHFINCCLQSASSWVAGTWQHHLSPYHLEAAKVTMNFSGKKTTSKMVG